MKSLSVILAMALVATGGAGLHFRREAGAGQQQIAELQAQLQELQRQRPAQAWDTRASTASPPTQAVTEMADTTQPAAPPVVAAASLIPDIATMRAQMASPEATAQRRQLTRLLMERSNPYISEALGLTPEETNQLLDALAMHQEVGSAIFTAPADGSSPPSPQERMAKIQAQQQTNESELQAMLGNKYLQWQDYRETRAAWQQLRDLHAVANAGGTPLTDSQGKSLVAALLVEQRSFNQQSRANASQGRSFAETFKRYSPERTQHLLDVAAAHLSPQQLEGYRGMLERAAAQERNTLAQVQALQPGTTTASP